VSHAVHDEGASKARGLARLLMYFGELLACSANCAPHYAREMTARPPLAWPRAAAQAWEVQLHNSVNRRLKKPERTLADIQAEYAAPTPAHAESVARALMAVAFTLGDSAMTVGGPIPAEKRAVLLTLVQVCVDLLDHYLGVRLGPALAAVGGQPPDAAHALVPWMHAWLREAGFAWAAGVSAPDLDAEFGSEQGAACSLQCDDEDDVAHPAGLQGAKHGAQHGAQQGPQTASLQAALQASPRPSVASALAEVFRRDAVAYDARPRSGIGGSMWLAIVGVLVLVLLVWLLVAVSKRTMRNANSQ